MQITTHHLPKTALIPNSPHPLLHYRNLPLQREPTATTYHDLFRQNGWHVQWIYRYGPTQRSHYHSTAHEAMVVLSGTATIRFGVADTSSDMHDNTHGTAIEHGGIEVEAKAGDVFVVPAGVAHKTFNARPTAEFALLSSGDGHRVAPPPSGQGQARDALDGVKLSGFTMLGAYPEGSEWDSLMGGEKEMQECESVWAVPIPLRDPVLGVDERGLVGLWKAKV